MTHFWLRSEDRQDEFRTPISPKGAEKLLREGFDVTVEDCEKRIFKTSEYKLKGCKIVTKGSWVTADKDKIITELEKRPTVEDLAAVTAERDARPTIDQIQDARNGSLVINSENGRATISLNIEESEDLKTWQTTGEKITKIIQLKDGKKFYRFALDK